MQNYNLFSFEFRVKYLYLKAFKEAFQIVNASAYSQIIKIIRIVERVLQVLAQGRDNALIAAKHPKEHYTTQNRNPGNPKLP